MNAPTTFPLDDITTILGAISAEQYELRAKLRGISLDHVERRIAFDELAAQDDHRQRFGPCAGRMDLGLDECGGIDGFQMRHLLQVVADSLGQVGRSAGGHVGHHRAHPRP